MADGKEVLQQYDFTTENYDLDIFLMVFLQVVFHILAYIFLLKKCIKIHLFYY